MRIQDGTVGFVLVQELQDEPAARDPPGGDGGAARRVLRQKPDALTAELAEPPGGPWELQDRVAALSGRSSSCSRSWPRIRHASANVVEITSDRERLRQQVAELTRARRRPGAGESRPEDPNQSALVPDRGRGLVGGVLMGLLLPNLRFGRRKSSWGSL